MGNKLGLENLAEGAALERFNYQLERVLENINDYNTPAETVRETTLTVKIKPNSDRTKAAVSILSKAKLATMKTEDTIIHINGLGATEHVSQQQSLGLEKS